MKVWHTIKKVLILTVISILFLIGISLMPLGWLSKSNVTQQEIPSGLIVNEIDQASMTYWNSDLKLTIEATDDQFEFLESILDDEVYLVTFSMDSTEGRTSDLTVELPVESMDDFLSHLSLIGKIEAIQTYTNNEVLINQDVVAWIENLSIQEQRYQELLKEKTDLDQLLMIEKELSRIRGELDDWQTLKRQSQMAIQMATIHLKVTLISHDDSWRGLITEELMIQMNRISQVSKQLVVKLIGFVPYLLIVAVLVAIGYGLFKRRKR